MSAFGSDKRHSSNRSEYGRLSRGLRDTEAFFVVQLPGLVVDCDNSQRDFVPNFRPKIALALFSKE
jgi:hypothetical protein